MKTRSDTRWLFPVLFLVIFFPSIGLSWSGKVVSVAEGDVVTILHDGKEEKIRLYGIDAPEKAQSFGQEARDFASALVAGKQVEVMTKNTDRYGRTVGLVSVDGQSLNELMVTNGYAWVYRQYCKESFCLGWAKTEKAARQSKKGMWSDSHIVPPWEFRRKGATHGSRYHKKVISSSTDPWQIRHTITQRATP